MLIISIIALIIIYSFILIKNDEKEFKNATRFNSKWINEFFKIKK